MTHYHKTIRLTAGSESAYRVFKSPAEVSTSRRKVVLLCAAFAFLNRKGEFL